MVQEGEYLLSHVGFSAGTPRLTLQKDSELIHFHPLHETLTMTFDVGQRFCRGWHDLATGEDALCPDSQLIGEKYEQCAACQNRTGFNPAFYHAKTVSPQQEARNLEPHFLYLAYFADDVVKVGISHAKRGNARLLEQGARSAVILETFPTAHIARHYEEQIAALPGMYETLQLSKKIALLAHQRNARAIEQTLAAVQASIQVALKVSFANTEVEHFDSVYFPQIQPDFSIAHHCEYHNISGKTVGLIGSLLVCEHRETPVFLPLKKYIGHKVAISFQETPLALPAQQVSLF